MSVSEIKSENVYRFGEITVDVDNYRASRSGQPLQLTPRAFDVLVFFVENAGRAVEKQEIFDAVWKDAFVSDNALTKIVKEIRRALGDDASRPRYIETVPKRGYRFVGIVGGAAETPASPAEEIISRAPGDATAAEKAARRPIAAAGPRFSLAKTAAGAAFGLVFIFVIAAAIAYRPLTAPAAGAPPLRSIAVLPFKPLVAGARDESLEMGMAETLITRLSNLKEVTVRPIRAVRGYTDLDQDPVEAGRELRTETVLDGSIQKSGERIRVTVRLINVESGQPLWSETFDENFTDIFKVQDSIAERVTGALALELSKQEKERLARHQTDNADAYQLYLRGQLIWHGRRQNWIEQSLAYYRQALEKDPNFALAHIGVADCYIMLSGHRRISMQEAERAARPSIMRALEIDNNLAQARNALAELKYQYEYDWTGAEKEFQKALELNPNVAWIRQAYGWFLMTTGRFDEASVEMEKAQQLDPSSLTINVGRGRLFYFSRQYDRALQHFHNIIAVEPNESSSYYSLHEVYEQKRMYDEMVDDFLRTMRARNAPPERIEAFREAFETSGWCGFNALQLEALEEKAKTEKIDPYAFARLYLRLGRRDEALEWLGRMIETKHPASIQLKIEPAYDELRGDPRFAELVRKIGLAP